MHRTGVAKWLSGLVLWTLRPLRWMGAFTDVAWTPLVRVVLCCVGEGWGGGGPLFSTAGEGGMWAGGATGGATLEPGAGATCVDS